MGKDITLNSVYYFNKANVIRLICFDSMVIIEQVPCQYSVDLNPILVLKGD